MEADSVFSHGSGKPLVFVHGYPLDHRMWGGQSALADRRRVVTLDLGGFGGTPAPSAALPSMALPSAVFPSSTSLPSAWPSPPSITAYAAQVLRAMDAEGISRAPLCGLSMGGYVLFEIWRRAPERVSSLILADTKAEADTPQERKARDANLELIRSGRREEVTEGMLAKLLSPGSFKDEALVATVRSMMDSVSREGFLFALEALRDRPDSHATLTELRVPVLVAVGRNDQITPLAAAERLQRGIRGSRLVSIPDAGHLAPLENPVVFNEALFSFLEDEGL